MTQPLYDIPLTNIDGAPTRLGEHAGQVMLVVNVASKCGLTPQYEGLQALYAARKDEGLVVLGFPANDFRGQEPGTESEIVDFCSTTYGVDFPMFQKISVVGPEQHPLYRALTAAKPKAEGDETMRSRLEGFGIEPNGPGEVLWNFEKFLIDRKGAVVGRFSPDMAADDPRLTEALDRALSAD